MQGNACKDDFEPFDCEQCGGRLRSEAMIPFSPYLHVRLSPLTCERVLLLGTTSVKSP